MKIRLAVMYGSRTCEHDVSIISALQALENVNREEYDAFPVYIAQDGAWYVGDALKSSAFYRNFDASKVTRVLPSGENEALELIEYPGSRRLIIGGAKRVVCTADVVMPVMHGMFGEDGTLQGLLDMMNVPYTSAGVLGSALGMDKIAMKSMLRAQGLPVLDDVCVMRGQWAIDREAVIRRIEGELSYPVFVKPANLGSSIGINRAATRDELSYALDIAAEYDRRILVEQGVTKLVEVNCSVLGFEEDVTASVCEMPERWDKLLSFEDKYLRGAKGSSQGMKSLGRRIPAPIPAEMTALIQDLSVKIFKALDLKGVVRIDFLIDEETNRVFIGEPNTIPGSLAFYLWEASGLKYAELIDKMVEFAFRAQAERNRSVFSYTSNILNSAGRGTKGGKLGAK